MTLFDGIDDGACRIDLGPGACVLRGFALSRAAALVADVARIRASNPPRHMATPGGRRIGAAMTNCGAVGWVSDRSGYRYEATDPATGRPWPAMPRSFAPLARRAARSAGFADFEPDACLVNTYVPGTGMTLHRDADEQDFAQPIVSVSLGIGATFLWGGPHRRAPVVRVELAHGDVVVFGGPTRLHHHGVAPVPDAHHPAFGRERVNLTFRRAR